MNKTVCQTCRINAQFQDKLKLGMAECRNRVGNVPMFVCSGNTL